MREIKFRAWDGSRYYYFDNHEFDLIYNDISGWNIAPNVPKYSGKWTTGESSDTAKNFVLEQFTGLFDKNNLEIYEGDILKGILDVNRLIIYDKGAFQSIAPSKGFSHSLWMSAIAKENDMEVIGNIHENPELLK